MKKLIITLAAALMAFGLTLGFSAGSASAAPRTNNAPASFSLMAPPSSTVSAASVPVGTQIMVPTGWSDCKAAASRGSNPRAKLIYALANWRCSGTIISVVGSLSADHICWGSRQWWGAPYRWVVGMVTGGQYSTC